MNAGVIVPPHTRIDLLRLLGVSDLDEFLENTWERTTYVTRAAVQDSLTEILTQDQFEILMAGAGSGLSVVEDHIARSIINDLGDSTRLALAFDAYRRGCTLLQSGLQLRWPPITHICRGIENELISHNVLLVEAVGANAYLTPADAQGFDIHYDNHCALILQLHGSKHWTVFPPLEELPITRCGQAIPRDQLSAPIVETNLVAGDVLYVPRGFPHFANSGDSSSLHLTLSLRTMTWLEVVNALCVGNTAFRHSVRLFFSGGLPAQEHFQRELIPQFACMEVNGYLRRRLLESMARLSPVPNGRLRAIDGVAAVDATTPVRRASSVTCVSSEEDGQAVLRFPGATLRLPAAMKPVFDFVAEHEEFTASELPTVNAVYDSEEFMRILIRKGLVCPGAAILAVDDVAEEEI